MDKFFHVSYDDLGESFEFTPRMPKWPAVDECRVSLRICVSRTIEGCLLGIAGVRSLNNYLVPNPDRYPPIAVYELHSDNFRYPTKSECHDSTHTGEIWILSKTIGTRVGYIDMLFLKNVGKVKIIDQKQTG